VVIVLAGAAGAGKTTIGRTLAETLGWPFVDADDYHATAAVAKMRAGTALTDADRAAWLATLHRVIATAIDRRESLVLACSALKERYRAMLRGNLRGVRFVYLKASDATLRARLASRAGHFAGPDLLDSQLATLEEPRDAIEALTVDAASAPERIIRAIRDEFGQ
jgi:gluconokinase